MMQPPPVHFIWHLAPSVQVTWQSWPQLTLQVEQRLRRANFEHRKTIEDFDFHFNPNIPKALVIDLATCAFVVSDPSHHRHLTAA